MRGGIDRSRDSRSSFQTSLRTCGFAADPTVQAQRSALRPAPRPVLRPSPRIEFSHVRISNELAAVLRHNKMASVIHGRCYSQNSLQDRAAKFAREVRRATLVLTASMNSYSNLKFSKLSFASAVTRIRLRTVDLNFGYEF